MFALFVLVLDEMWMILEPLILKITGKRGAPGGIFAPFWKRLYIYSDVGIFGETCLKCSDFGTPFTRNSIAVLIMARSRK